MGKIILVFAEVELELALEFGNLLEVILDSKVLTRSVNDNFHELPVYVLSGFSFFNGIICHNECAKMHCYCHKCISIIFAINYFFEQSVNSYLECQCLRHGNLHAIEYWIN